MIKNLIAKHIQNLKIEDIYDFASKNNVILTSNEANTIYTYIKKYWKELIFEDHNIILNKIKDSIEPSTYNKINELIIFYKNKYKHYL